MATSSQRCGLIVAVVTLLAACATTREMHDKTAAGDTERSRDEAACLREAVGGPDPRFLLLPLKIDREAYEQCMRTRGYTIRSAAMP